MKRSVSRRPRPIEALFFSHPSSHEMSDGADLAIATSALSAADDRAFQSLRAGAERGKPALGIHHRRLCGRGRRQAEVEFGGAVGWRNAEPGGLRFARLAPD